MCLFYFSSTVLPKIIQSHCYLVCETVEKMIFPMDFFIITCISWFKRLTENIPNIFFKRRMHVRAQFYCSTAQVFIVIYSYNRHIHITRIVFKTYLRQDKTKLIQLDKNKLKMQALIIICILFKGVCGEYDYFNLFQ